MVGPIWKVSEFNRSELEDEARRVIVVEGFRVGKDGGHLLAQV